MRKRSFRLIRRCLGRLIDFAIGGASGETVLDLYCGVGLFTLPLARQFEKVIGVEVKSDCRSLCARELTARGTDECACDHCDGDGLVSSPILSAQSILSCLIRRVRALSRQ